MDNNLDLKEVAKYYNGLASVWPANDPWYQHTQSQISDFICKHPFNKTDYVLNAGSGDKDYNIIGRVHCVDIAEERIKDKPLFTVASIEDMPFEDKSFDGIVCVGSVLNYCDAVAAISELSRVLRSKGKMLLEFESSCSYEYKGTSSYAANADLVITSYYGQPHKIWLFSPQYIKSLLYQNGFKILTKEYFHILSTFAYSLGKSEVEAARYAKYDKIAKLIPCIRKLGCNVILECVKL